MRGPACSTTSMRRVALFLWAMGSTGDTVDLKITVIFCRDLTGGHGAAELRRQSGFSLVFGYCVPKGLLTYSGLHPWVAAHTL